MKREEIVVFDFETTGFMPKNGGRPIEIGAVKLRGKEIVDRFQSLIDPGYPLSPFITTFTGINDSDLINAPSVPTVMRRFADFIQDCPLVAHNAKYDMQFLNWELESIGICKDNHVGCSLKIARKLLPEAPNHKLATLIDYCGIASDNIYHRALADAEKTALLWLYLLAQLEDTYFLTDIDFPTMLKIGSLSKKQLRVFLSSARNPSLFSLKES